MSDWGFEGVLAAIDRGYLEHWRRIVDAVLEDPGLVSVLTQAMNAAESRSTVRGIELLLAYEREQPKRVRPSVLVERHRDELLRLAAGCGLSNVRIFGSVARGEDGPDSDVDVLAHIDEEHRKQPFKVFSFVVDAEDLLGVPVDLVFDHSTGPAMPVILAEAVPL